MSWEILKAEKDEGVPVALASGWGSIGELAVDDTSVYWLDISNILIVRLDKSGGEPVMLASPPEGIVTPPSSSETCMVLDDAYIYFAKANAAPISKVDKRDGELVTLTAKGTAVCPIAVDEESIYWVQRPRDDFNECKPAIVKASKLGDAVTILSYDDSFSAIAVDDSFIYYATESGEMKRLEK